ncbi:MAG: hypothetical protein LBI10_13100 [Deltaproteobacteria bacterium]|jgi:hypothetical protein|nr:hypothetical protein [Deltaproteobacteria bacterium]
MLCPKCGYNSFEYNDSCPKCHHDLKPTRRSLSLTTPKPGVVDFFSFLGGSDALSSSASLDPNEDFDLGDLNLIKRP